MWHHLEDIDLSLHQKSLSRLIDEVYFLFWLKLLQMSDPRHLLSLPPCLMQEIGLMLYPLLFWVFVC